MRKTTFAAAAFLGFAFLGLPVRASEIPEKDFARRDLIAQEGMNRGTSGIMILTFMQMILAGAGTVAVLASLEMSRRALRQAQLSAEIQRDIAREQLRAYLGGEEPLVERFNVEGMKINFPIKNFGATPARNVQIWSYSNVVHGVPRNIPIALPGQDDFGQARTVVPNGKMGWYCGAEFGVKSNAMNDIESKKLPSLRHTLSSTKIYSVAFTISVIQKLEQVLGFPTGKLILNLLAPFMI